MGFHTFPIERADALEAPGRYRFCSREELLDALEPAADDTVADLGSGTGFYTTDVAPFVDTLYAVDVQAPMHERHRENGITEPTELVTATISSLPFPDETLDGAFSVMTHHEYADEATLAELARVLKPDGRLVTVDWSRDGTGTDGPPLEERFGLQTVTTQLETAGFEIVAARNRPETMLVSATRSQ